MLYWSKEREKYDIVERAYTNRGKVGREKRGKGFYENLDEIHKLNKHSIRMVLEYANTKKWVKWAIIMEED